MNSGLLIPLHGGDPIQLDRSPLMLGRNSKCDITIRHRTVSGLHCRLELHGGVWVIEDLDSHNGIRVDGVRCRKKRLEGGCVVTIGAVRFEVALPVAPADTTTTAADDDLAFAFLNDGNADAPISRSPEPKPVEAPVTEATGTPEQADAKIPARNREIKRFRGKLTPKAGGDLIALLTERVVIGRSSDCDVVLAYPAVSSQHCELQFREGYWFANDLDSRNGIRIDGESVKSGWLMPGSTLSVAKFRFEIDYQPTSSEPPPMDNLLERSLMERAGLTKELEKNANPGWLKSDQDPEQVKRIDLDAD